MTRALVNEEQEFYVGTRAMRLSLKRYRRLGNRDDLSNFRIMFDVGRKQNRLAYLLETNRPALSSALVPKPDINRYLMSRSSMGHWGLSNAKQQWASQIKFSPDHPLTPQDLNTLVDNLTAWYRGVIDESAGKRVKRRNRDAIRAKATKALRSELASIWLLAHSASQNPMNSDAQTVSSGGLAKVW